MDDALTVQMQAPPSPYGTYARRMARMPTCMARRSTRMALMPTCMALCPLCSRSPPHEHVDSSRRRNPFGASGSLDVGLIEWSASSLVASSLPKLLKPKQILYYLQSPISHESSPLNKNTAPDADFAEANWTEVLVYCKHRTADRVTHCVCSGFKWFGVCLLRTVS
jgi:hypothetical protein